jgi:hypothetical protein
MKDIYASPDCKSESLAFQHAYLNRDELDLEKLYEGYDAAADFTDAAFYKEMLAKYHDAKVILTERSAESWFKSVQNIIFKAISVKVDPSDPQYELSELSKTLIFDGLMKDPKNFDNEELFTKMYLDHNAEVKRLVPTEKLYIMQLGEGWEGLCKFFRKDIPDVQYPNINSAESLHQFLELDKRIATKKATETLKATSGL